MKKINSKIIFVVVLALLFILAFTACQEDDPSPTPTNTGEQITVLEAVEMFLDSLNKSGTQIGNVININLTAQYVDGDNTYDIIFQTNIDSTASSNDINKIYLEIRNSGGVAYAGIYYMNGVLYLQIPLEDGTTQKIYINDLSMADVISYMGPVGEINFSSFKNTFALVVESAEYSSSEDIETITYHLNMEELFETIFDLFSEELTGIDPDLLLRMLGTTSDQIIDEMADYDDATITVEIEDGFFNKFAYNSGEGTTFSIDSFTLGTAAGDVSSINPLEYTEYSPTNVDIEGSLSLNVEAGNYNNTLGDVAITSNLTDAEYSFDFRIRAAMSALNPSENRMLIELSSGEEWAISVYYDAVSGYIYWDLSDLNAGKIKISADELTELINTIAEEIGTGEEVTEPEEEEEISDLDFVLNLIGIVAPGISLSSDSVEFVLNAERFNAFFSALGIDWPIDITECGVTMEREGLAINDFLAWLTVGGLTVELSAETINVGPTPTIPAPVGLGAYVDTEDLSVFTFSTNGVIEFNTAQSNITSFLEGLLQIFTGEEIELSTQTPPAGNTLNYNIDITYSAESGNMDALSIELYDSGDRYVLGLIYQESTGTLYVIQPEIIPMQTIFSVSEYQMTYDIAEIITLITGVASPVAPTDASALIVTNALNSITAQLNYNGVADLVEFINQTLFNSEETIASEYVFNSISLTIGDSVETTIGFSGGKSITVSAEDINVSYEPVTMTGITESITKSVSSGYLDNNLYDTHGILTLNFSNGTSKKFRVEEWTYNLNGFVMAQGGSVVASTEILGNTINVTLQIQPSSISSLQGSYQNMDLTFDKNDFEVDPIAYITSHDTLTVNGTTIKELDWDLSELNGANTNGTYNIQGIIYDYFGREKRLPDVDQYYTVTITGRDITSHLLDKTFEPYGGIDPADVSSYPATAVLTMDGVLTTAPGAVGDLIELEWNLDNVIAAYNDPSFKAYEDGLSVNVTVYAMNNLGTRRPLTAHVTITTAVMTGVNFIDALLNNGKELDNGLDTSSEASGVYWNDAGSTLVFNPLRVSSLYEAILPATVTMTTVSGNCQFSGLKWEFIPFDFVGDTYGRTYTNALRLIIGDAIGGYQTTYVTIKIEDLEISNFVLLDAGNAVITTENVPGQSLYKTFTIDNPYDYKLPVKTRVTTDLGQFTLVTSWSFPTFDTSSLYNGGEYEGTYQAGSQQLRARVVVNAAVADMNGLTFREEEELEGTDLYFDSVKGLVFNPYTSPDFTDSDVYPTTGYALFTDALGNPRNLVVPLNWDISAITELYSSGNPNMYNGKSIIVTAYTDYIGCGVQYFDVKVYIEEAVIDVENTVFSLGNPTQLLEFEIFGKDDMELTFTDARLTINYPETIRVSYIGAELETRIIPMLPEDVNVENWDISEILAAYESASIISGVSGIFNVIATVGTVRGGFQEIELQVEIVSSELDNPVFTDIPLLSDGTPAFLYDDTPGDGYIATFTFDPYASNIKSAASYPASLTFDLDLDGVTESFDMSIDWYLDSVSAVSPYLGGTYTVVAAVPLADDSYLPVPVRIVVSEKLVDTLNGQGLFNIFIDPLDETPFGRRNTTSEQVMQTVEVTFTGDTTVMTLTLLYDRSEVLVDFGGVSYMVEAYVGNDFGGYQPIGLDGKIQIAVIQREIENIYTDDVTELELYERIETEVPGSDYTLIEENNPNILYYEEIPTSMLFKFTGVEEEISVPIKTEDSVGLCFDWIYVDEYHREIVIYNIIPAFMNTSGEDTVFISNPIVQIEAYALQDVTGILIVPGNYSSVWNGGIVDVYDYLDSHDLLNYESMDLDPSHLECEYYLNGVLIDSSEVLDAGVYTLRINVENDHVYGGYDEVQYTILPQDISMLTEIFYEGVKKNTTNPTATPAEYAPYRNITHTLEFSGEGIEYTANIIGYDYIVTPVYENDEAPVDVGTYTISFEIESFINFTCYNTVTLTITKVNLDETSEHVDVDYPESVIYESPNFDVTLTVYGDEIEDYTLQFFTDSECLNEVGDISLLDVGTYYLRVYFDGGNYEVEAVKSFDIEPGTIEPADYTFYASDMGSGQSGPVLNMTIFGGAVNLSSVVPEYFSDSACTIPVVDISAAPNGQYWVRVTVLYDNYNPVIAVDDFHKVGE